MPTHRLSLTLIVLLLAAGPAPAGASVVTAGSGTQVNTDVVHPNGRIYDQVVLTGSTVTVTADPDQITRVSFIDLNDGIVHAIRAPDDVAFAQFRPARAGGFPGRPA